MYKNKLYRNKSKIHFMQSLPIKLFLFPCLYTNSLCYIKIIYTLKRLLMRYNKIS